MCAAVGHACGCVVRIAVAVNRLTGMLQVTNVDAGFSGARTTVEMRKDICRADSMGVAKVEH